MNYYHDENNTGYSNNTSTNESQNNPYGNYTYRYSYQTATETKKKKTPFAVKAIVAGLIFGLVAGGTTYGTFKVANGVFGPVVVSEGNNSSSGGGAQTGSNIKGTAVSTATAVNDVSDIAKNVMPAIVQVTNVSVVEYRGFFGQIYSQPSQSAGSGVIIGEDGDNIFIATNNHVVSGSREITITFSDGEAYAGELQGTYPDGDLAVVKVPKSGLIESTANEIKIASLADSDSVSVGQATVVIGNALGYGQSVTTGVISALNREVTVRGDDGNYITNEMIQTDATINHGNSGGALLNMNGAVIGIVSAKYSGDAVEGMGYAIPITYAKEVIDEIISTGSYNAPEAAEDLPIAQGKGAYLGVYGGMDIDQSTSQRYGMPTGVYISQVVPGSAAEKAGLKSGDVIRGVNGRPVSSMQGLQNVLASYGPGEEVTIKVAVANNDYQDSEIQVVLGERPNS